MTDGITHNNFGREPPLQASSSTSYTSGPVTEAEDAAVTASAIESLATAMKHKMGLAFHNGWAGWHRPDECPIHRLVELFNNAVGRGDVVDIANYTMMLHGRGVTNISIVQLELERAALSSEIQELAELDVLLVEQYKSATLANTRAIIAESISTAQSAMSELQHKWHKLAANIQKGA